MKKKLLFVVHSLDVGGAERIVIQMALSLRDRYELAILCLDSQGLMWEQCQDQGFRLFCAHRKPGWSKDNFSRVISVFKTFKPDIVHAHQYTPTCYSVVAKFFGYKEAKLVFTEHGRNYPDVVSFKRRFANIFLFKFVDVFTAVSEFTRKSLINNERVRRKVKLIYNGLFEEEPSPEPRSLRGELFIPAGKRIVAYVGSLREVKNPLFLLRAFSKLDVERLNIVLVFIGEGNLKAKLESEIKRLGLSDCVYLAGTRVPATPYLDEFSVFVLPSFQEAASLALLEAMRAGVPVIVTNRGGSPELVKHERTGLVVDCGKETDLSSAIERIITCPEDRMNFVSKARRDVSSRFSFEKMLSSYMEIYENLA